MVGMRITRLVVLGALMAAVGASCSGGGSQASGGGGSGGSKDAARQPAARPADATFGSVDQGSVDQRAGGGGLSTTAAQHLPSIGPAIIKTADVEVEVPRAQVEATVRRAVEVAGRYGGFVASTSTTTVATSTGTVVVRVPSDRFEQALADLERLGDVAGESISGQDVTQEFVDLQARLRNWQSQEAVLLGLMERARSVADTIRVQGQLSQVQLEIERLRGRLNYLDDQTTMATITASFTPVGAPTPEEPTTLSRAWEEAVDGSLQVLAALIVGAGFVVPLAILAAVAIVVFRSVRPRLGS
jgi:Domain of unknown function (DUF4349)